MERHGSSDNSESDPVNDSADQGAETGLEEPMWQLGLGGGVGGGGEGSAGGGMESSYPERLGEADCIYYLRTGFCGYGARCRFNHPRTAVSGGGRPSGGGGEYPQRSGQPVCQYYMRTGRCKFGSSCKYHHPRQGIDSPSGVALNIYGYPLRPGEKECSYYMKTGQCKFGLTCKFHHPAPENVQVPAAPGSGATPVPSPATLAAPVVYPSLQSPSMEPTQQYGAMTGNWQVARTPSMVPGSYVQGPYGPMYLSTGMVPFAGWTSYPASVSAMVVPTTQSSVGAGQQYGMPTPSPMVSAYPNWPYPPPVTSSTGPSSSVLQEQSYPLRPGQPECQHFMKTGECKFGPSCRYHHPAELIGQKSSSAITSTDLTIHPEAPICTHFMQHGVCKFGSSCRFNHPVGPLSYSPSPSSLADMSVAPYPVGSSVTTLAPSASSSDLQTEPSSSGSTNNKDSSARISSSTSPQTTSASLDKSGSAPLRSSQSTQAQ